jgi:hypothetical protein
MNDRELGLTLDRVARKANANRDALAAGTQAAAGYAQYKNDPRGFVMKVLGGKSATRRSNDEEYQFSWLEMVRDNEQTAIRCGHRAGKSVVAGWLALWWVCTRVDALVIILTPTLARQGKGIVAREMEKWAVRGRISLRGDSEMWHFDANRSRIVALTGSPADVGMIEGQHGTHTLLLCDEAKTLQRDVFDALAGALAGEEGRTALLSTCGGPTGIFYDACTDKSGAWAQSHVGSDDSSNVRPDWVEQRKKAWGPKSSMYRMRVEGEFPTEGSSQLFSWSLLHAARDQASLVLPLPADFRRTTMGVDCARSLLGDHSAAAIVREGLVVYLEKWHAPTTTETVEKVALLAMQYRPDVIRVDTAGVGAGIADGLIQRGLPVQQIFFGGKAFDPERHANYRVDAYIQTKERLERGTLRLPAESEELREELAAAEVRFDKSGKLILASKDEIRTALGRSPDLADSLVMAIAGDDPDAWHQPPADELRVGFHRFANDAWRAQFPYAADGLYPSGDPLLWAPGHERDREAMRTRLEERVPIILSR